MILRRIPYGDTSWILHAFSLQDGPIGLLARGARRAGSPFAGTLEPLSEAEIVVSVRPGRDLQTLSQASTVELHEGLRRDLAASAAGMVCAETVLRFVREPGGHPGIYRELARALGLLDAGYSAAPLWRFLGRFSEEMGWALAVDHCAQCGMEDIPPAPVLSLPHGGFLCRECGIRSHAHPLSPERAAILRACAANETLPELACDRGEMDAIEDTWFEHIERNAHLRPRMESRQFLSEVRP